MPVKILGLDINDDSIAAVQVTSTLKGYQITACAYVRITEEEDPDSVLKDLFAQTDLKSDVCHSSIPGEQASYRNLQLPFKDIKKIRQTLPFELEAIVPFPIEDRVVDFTIIDQSDKSDILSAAVNRTVVSQHLEQLRIHGVDPDALDIRGVTTVAWLLKQKQTPDDGIFLQLDGKRNTMVLFLKRRIALVRTFVSDNSPDSSAPDTANHEGPDSPPSVQAESYYKSFCVQVQNTIHGFGSRNNQDIHPEKVLFSGSKSLLPNAEEHISRFLDIPAEQVDLSRNEKIHMDGNIARAWDPALMGNALALALRDTKQDQCFNFRKDEFEKKKHYFGPREEIRKAAVFFIILLCFLTANIGAGFHLLKKRHDQLNNQITDIFKKTFPEIKRIVDPEKQMEIEINKIKNSSIPLPAAGGKNSVLTLLNDISQRIPGSITVHLTSVIFDVETVRLSGNTDTFNTVDKIKNDLESSEFFKAATISSAKLDRTGSKVEFEIKLERAG